MADIENFTISIDDDALEDLHRRLAATRWPDQLPGGAWQRGVPLDWMRQAIEYWQTSCSTSRRTTSSGVSHPGAVSGCVRRISAKQPVPQGARAEYVTRPDDGAATGVGDEVAEGPGRDGCGVTAGADAVESNLGGEAQAAVGVEAQFIGSDEPRPEGDGGVLGRRGAHRELELVHLQVAGRPGQPNSRGPKTRGRSHRRFRITCAGVDQPQCPAQPHTPPVPRKREPHQASRRHSSLSRRSSPARRGRHGQRGTGFSAEAIDLAVRLGGRTDN